MTITKSRRVYWRNILERIKVKREEKNCPARKNRKRKDNGVLTKKSVLNRIPG